MKLIYSEAQNNYKNYLFSYQVLLIKENHDSVDEIYGRGFLPVRSIRDLYYLSRNCRIDLSKYELSSENKRVLKALVNTEIENLPLNKFRFKKDDYQERSYLNDLALKRIFSPKYNYTDVIIFSGKGVVLTYQSKDLIHYAHSFYSAGNIGISMMTYVVNMAKELKKKYIYLGTCYGMNSYYKTQFKGFEYFDGITWSDDLDKLKYLFAKDGENKQSHLFQESEYLKRFFGVKNLSRLVSKLRNEK